MAERPAAQSAHPLARVEDAVATLAALGVILLPLAEVVLRRLFDTGIPGAAPFTSHLTLVVGLAGAAIAARQGKLLAMATGTLLPAGAMQDAAKALSALVGSAVATVLAFGGVRLLQVHREAAKPIALGVPVWVADLAFPIAFGLIALRLVWQASPRLWVRAGVALGIAAGAWISQHPQILDGAPAWPGIAILVLAAVAGMPIFALLGGAAVFLFLAQGDSPANAIIGSYDQLTSTDLPALPLFTLAGFLLAEGRASERLLRLFRACFGWMPGGTAVVTAALCAFFTVFTGGSGVTILALGGLLLPALLADKYRESFSLGLLTASGSLGLLFPPALPLILYGIVAGVAIGDLFLGGLLPGLVMLTFLALLGVREGIVSGSGRTPFHLRAAVSAVWRAKWELLMPIVILGSLFAGATTVQSAALVALYTLVVQRVVQRELTSFGDLRRVVSAAIAVIGGVLVILAVAVGFTTYLIDAQVPARMVDWVQANIHSAALFLLALNVFLIIVGCLMDIFSAIVVVVPLIVPIARVYGIDPVHLGVIFIANLELGYLTPPVGLNLFLSSYRFNKPVLQIARASLPMLGVLAAGVLLITYVPWLTTGLLDLLGRTQP
ncbi:MAG TPA: TRAP transporter large permease subunit [Vicinamibacterales bacterium]|nr:TRAP transporter large permease subunit [Vicinamibacterales bacterium]HPW21189.1 TRAP transporter large permease subunit [Vicinamibacterales bacterium]